ncbi:MAG: putative N6-adenine-specific methylase containing domain protein [Labilithrix sp.]|nr:putative N6-adenine-specific methylase containing domain protein [Labilithrix sp.]
MASSLAERVRDHGYTPGIRDLGALLDLFATDDDELARHAERAILRIEPRHAMRLAGETVRRADTATRPARGRLARLLGRVASAAEASPQATAHARGWLSAALADADPKTRHAAARALGKLRPEDDAERAALEQSLLEAWDRGTEEDRRALADALGKVGSAEARERLAQAGAGATRAGLVLEREIARTQPGAIDLSRSLGSPITVRFHARTGLEQIVANELGERWRPRIAGAGVVDARLDGPLGDAAAIRTALHFGFPLDPVTLKDEAEIAEAIVRALLAPRALAVLRAFTAKESEDGAIRFRLAWASGGHRRALAWRCAELVAKATRELVNDPTESTWEVLVDVYEGRVALELVPRGYRDERFAYRKATVPASSHPTIAAALVQLAPSAPGDVVWDPFVGAGAELVERARRGPYRRLIGTDIDEAALDAARENLAAAGIEGTLLARADATTFDPGMPVDLIVTNPPMGRRVQRGTHGDVLERFIDHAAKVLAPGGALVWAAPEPGKLHARAKQAGLVLERAFTIDMGGFPAELSIARKQPGPA